MEEALPITPAFWKGFWDLLELPADARKQTLAIRTLGLAGELDPRINARMAAAAMAFPGVAEATARGLPEPFDVDALAGLPAASLGYALRQQLMGNEVGEAFWRSVIPLLRHMPPPLNYINIRVIQTLPLISMVAGYSARQLDRAALGGFLMAQVGHHFSALSTAISLTQMSLARPATVELTLDAVFKGWTHGRESPPLIGAPWEELWGLRIDQVREALKIAPFASPYAAAEAAGGTPRKA
jgi:ubiquinone biosynthesis protein Coq4